MGVFLSMSLSQGRSSNDVVTKNDESIVSGLVQGRRAFNSIRETNASKKKRFRPFFLGKLDRYIT